MATKTDLGAITLTNSEIAAAAAKGAHPTALLTAAKQGAADVAAQLGEVIKMLPAGSNKTALVAIQTALL
ncbi:hypothetical protein J2792_002344 [Novosphingobium capsulatum]|uniref:Peptidase S50 domain-containing protein n=1 Tax=Novosphingobium capsulatum TaxID=13688 RepID=A0ABU1MN71_9SPHN|nr:hypothetical protein [Novosphingobium capsulatum]MDR6511472.1 hypothetical protein [Novosphingobium capsulatum]